MPSGRFGHSDLTKLLTPSIRGLEQTVGVKSEDRSLFGANRGTYKLSGWKNAQRQVWAFRSDQTPHPQHSRSRANRRCKERRPILVRRESRNLQTLRMEECPAAGLGIPI